MSSGVFLSWTAHGRSADLAMALGLRHEVISSPRRALLVRYLHQSYVTYRRLRRDRPDAVIVMQPPAPALIATVLAVGRTATVIADLHTGFFEDRKWSWFTATGLRLLRRRHYALVTNEHLRQRCARAGVRAVIVHDVTAPAGPSSRPAASQGTRRPRVVVPLSYARDEPVPEIMSAARSMPDAEFVLTGRPPESITAGAPGNVHFSGYLHDVDYIELLSSADVALALTMRPHTMLRAGYEAMRYGIPLVTSESPALRQFFGEAAAYAGVGGDSLADALRSVLGRRGHYQRAMVEVREQRQAEQRRQLEELSGLLGNRP